MCQAPVRSHPIRSPGVRSRRSRRGEDPHTWPSSRLQERGLRWLQAHLARLGGQTDQVASIPSLGTRPWGFWNPYRLRGVYTGAGLTV